MLWLYSQPRFQSAFPSIIPNKRPSYHLSSYQGALSPQKLKHSTLSTLHPRPYSFKQGGGEADWLWSGFSQNQKSDSILQKYMWSTTLFSFHIQTLTIHLVQLYYPGICFSLWWFLHFSTVWIVWFFYFLWYLIIHSLIYDYYSHLEPILCMCRLAKVSLPCIKWTTCWTFFSIKL